MLSVLLTIALSGARGAPEFELGNEDTRMGFRGTRQGGRQGVTAPTAPFFVFANTTAYAGIGVGSGMGTPCACATVYGYANSAQVALTTTRASSAFCNKQGSATSGLVAGDLVLCTANQSRVGMEGGNWALLSEASAINVIQYYDAVGTAPWGTTTDGGATVASVSADSVTNVDNTATADAVTFGATGTGQISAISQGSMTAAAYSCGVNLMGLAGDAGTLDSCTQTSGGATCISAPYVAGTWTRTCNPNITSTAGGVLMLGNATALNGGTSRPAQTVAVSFVQCETGSVCTSPIATTNASAARSADLHKFTFTGGPAPQSWSMAMTRSGQSEGSMVASAGLMEAADTAGHLGTGASAMFMGNSGTSNAVCQGFNAAVGLWSSALAALGSATSTRRSCYGTTAAGVAGLFGATTMAVSTAPPMTGTLNTASTVLQLGGQANAAANNANGWYSNVCFDSTSTRCR